MDWPIYISHYRIPLSTQGKARHFIYIAYFIPMATQGALQKPVTTKGLKMSHAPKLQQVKVNK